MRSRPHFGRRSWLSCSVSLPFCLAFFSIYVQAQIYSGSLTGLVSDPSGAVVPGATISLIDVGKGYAFTALTDGVGRYVLRSLPPSTYKLKVELKGFKTHVQSNLALDVNQNATVDVILEVGTSAQSVEVTAAPPMLAVQDAVTGQELNRTFINSLPLINRSVLDLAFLTPGVSQAAGSSYGETGPGGGDIKRMNNFVSNGGRNATADVLLDGVTSTQAEPNGAVQQTSFTPSVDAVQEFKVQQNNFTAEIGFSGATVVTMVTRSGTNTFHGSVYEYLRNEKLDANNWFNNAYGQALPPLRNNEFGATVGGPIRKDRTFFFVDYQGTRQHSMGTFGGGVPSAEERKGNFGEICARNGGTFDTTGLCSASEGQIWDPYSGVYNPNGYDDRSAFVPFNDMATYQSAGNPNLNGTGYQLAAAPGNLMDPTALKMLQYYPSPNLGVGTSGYNPYNNFYGTGIVTGSNDQFDVKVDHRFSDKDLLSAKFSRSWQMWHDASCYQNALDPCSHGATPNHPAQFSLNHTHTVSPNTVLNLSYGWLRFFQDRPGNVGDYPNFSPVKDLGLPGNITASGIISAPTIRPSNYSAIGPAAWSGIKWGQETHHLLASLSQMRGRHELKVGGETRVRRLNFMIAGTPAGLFTFGKHGTSQQWGGGGDSFATFLTGVGGPDSWGQYEVPAFLSTQNLQYAGYFQDNWRVTDKLTLNLGIRYDLNMPRTERHNRQSWFDPNATSPLQVPGLALRGGAVFADSSTRSPFDANYHDFGPRIGLAYRLNPKTVLRGGYGIFYGVPKSTVASVTGGGADGFYQITPWVTSYQSDHATPWGRLSDPWPITGPKLPTGSSLGLLTYAGLAFSYPVPFRNLGATPYTQTWSLGFQREFPGAVVFEANYVGTKGTRLNYFVNDWNTLGPDVAAWPTDQIAALNNLVPNPFYGIITDPAAGEGPQVAAYQLLRPFPQFGQVRPTPPPVGNSIYHALQIRVEKRMSNGLQLLVTYTNAKAIDDCSTAGGDVLGGNPMVQDPNRRFLERSVSGFDIPQTFQFSYVYDLPWGRGRHWGTNWNKWVNGFLGGWQTNGIWRFDNGQPIQLALSNGQAIPTYGSQRPNLLAPLKRNTGSNWRDQYFANPDVAVVPPAFTLGTAPRYLPNLRVPGTNNASLSLFKDIPLGVIREGAHLQYRVEAFNALNHPVFCGPDGTVDGGTFGLVTSQCNSPREVQMALKFYW